MLPACGFTGEGTAAMGSAPDAEPAHPIRRTGVLRAAVGGLGVALIAAAALGPGPVTVAAREAAPAVACAAVLLGIRLHRPRSAVGWYVVAVSVLLFSAPEYLAPAVPAAVAHRRLFAALEALGPLGGFAALFGAAVQASRAMHARTNGAELVDVGLVVAAVGTAMMDLVVLPLDHTIHASGLVRFAVATAPASGLVVMAVLLRLSLATAEPVPALAALQGVTALSMGAFLWVAIAERTGGPWAVAHGLAVSLAAWTAAGVLTGLAALHPSMRRLAEPCRRRPDALGRWRTLTLGLALLVPPVATALQVSVLRQPFVAGSLVVPSLAVTALVLMRIHQIFVAREAVQAELALRERRFRLLVENLRDHLLVVRDGRVAYQSPSVERLLGLPADRLAHEGLAAVLPPAEQPAWEALAARARAGGSPEGVLRGRTADGEERTFSATATDLAADPAVGGTVVVLHDITERQRVEGELRRQALRDPLTGLANRTLVLDRAQHMLVRARRTWRAVAALFIDLDNFKLINDSLGHAAGDELLRGVAERLRRAVRAADTLGRLGGDEFVVLLDRPGEEDAPELVAERIREVLGAPFEVAGHPYTLQASIGIALRTVGSAEDLLRDADISMDRAKREGRNRVVVFQPQMQAVARARFELETDLRAAVASGALEVVYQPSVDLRDLRVTGMEALARWTHPERGPVSPAEFVPLAEEIGLIGELGRGVLRQACHTAAGWQARQHGLAVSVNVSGRQLDGDELVGHVREALQESGLPAACLVLEITESALMREAAVAARSMRALKALGVRIAIDDFGTGFSSLAYLRQFPADVLKIDRAFIRDVQNSAQAVAVVQTLVRLGKALNLEVVAEGVEVEAQLAALRRQQCDTAQGFLFARPLASEAVDGFLREWARGGPAGPRGRTIQVV